MGAWLNNYYSIMSPTNSGKSVKIETINHPWQNNPWTEIANGKVRYRRDRQGNLEIEKGIGGGDWTKYTEPSDQEYWEKYVKQVEKKIEGQPAQNVFQYYFKKQVPIKQEGSAINYAGLF